MDREVKYDGQELLESPVVNTKNGFVKLCVDPHQGSYTLVADDEMIGTFQSPDLKTGLFYPVALMSNAAVALEVEFHEKVPKHVLEPVQKTR